MRKLILFVGVFILTLGSTATGFYLYQYRSQPHQVEINDAAPVISSQTVSQQELIGKLRPDFSLPDINGEMRHISEWDGQVIALNFWATWCPPCLKEIPEFIALQDKYSQQGLQFIGIALQSAEDVKEFMQTQEMNYPVLVGELEVIELARAYGNDMGTLPYTVIIDREKRISYIKHGQLAGDIAEEIISTLL